MDLLKLKSVYCADKERNDISRVIPRVIAVLTTNYPRDIIWMGRVLPSGYGNFDLIYTEQTLWWLLGYSPSSHMVFARSVPGNFKFKVLNIEHRLYTAKGAYSVFDAVTWDTRVYIEKNFNELEEEQVSDEALIASLISFSPSQLSVELGYSLFELRPQHEVILPYVTDWLGLNIPAGIKCIHLPEGVRHIAIYSSLSEPAIYLPDSLTSCYIAPDISLRLSISKQMSKHWLYWSAVWGKKYILKPNFVCTPDGLVTVRPAH